MNFKPHQSNGENSPYELLSMYRRRSGLTQTQLAHQIGLKSYQSISDWESGQSLPRPETLKRLIELYIFGEIFFKGQEYQEAYSLWLSIKNMFDLSGAIYRLYPPFDQSWFSSLTHLTARITTNTGLDLTISTDEEQRPISTPTQEQELPGQSLKLIGRDTEVKELIELIENKQTRLLTLVGPGGIGKTRLALEIAFKLLASFKDGIRWVDLSYQRESARVPQAIARSLKLHDERDGVAVLKEYLAKRQLLLILDNFEQVLEAANLIPELLSAATGLKVLVTSREPLRLYQEQVYELLPLALPAQTTNLPVENVAEFGSVQLFMERATMVNPAFKLTAENKDAVVQICTRLEGIPLAMELTAGHLKFLSPDNLLNLLNTSLLAFPSDVRNKDIKSHHQTMRSAIEWSYKLLEVGEQQLFQITGLFNGGFSLEGITTVYSAVIAEYCTQVEVFELLKGLVLKSLLRVEPTGDGRFNTFQIIREYALDQLKESDKLDKAYLAFTRYYSEIIERHGNKKSLLNGNGRKELEREYSNIAAGLEWAIRRGETQLALKICLALGLFWDASSYYAEGRHYLKQVLALPFTDNLERGQALYQASFLLRRQGNYGESARLVQESLEIFERLDNKAGMANALENLGVVTYKQGYYERAKTFLENSYSLYRELRDEDGQARALTSAGNLCLNEGEYELARQYFETGMLLEQKLGHHIGSIGCRVNLANLWFRQGDYRQARDYCLENLIAIQEFGNKDQRAMTLNLLAGIEFNSRNYAESGSYLKEALKLKLELDHKYGLAIAYSSLGIVDIAQQNYREARQNLEKALTLSYEIGAKQTTAYCLNSLGLLALKKGDLTLAARYQRESLLIEEAIKDTYGICYNLTGHAARILKLSLQRSNLRLKLLERAVILIGVVTTLLNQGVGVLDPLFQDAYDEVMLRAKEHLSNESFETSFDKGKLMSLEEAIKFSLGNI